MAAVSLAEEPARIKDIFLVDQKNSAGVYAATMYLLGMPITVTVDDYLPLDKHKNKPIYGGIGEDDGALWGAIFEKMFAKFYGNYVGLEGGVGSDGITAMTGAPDTYFVHEDVMKDSSLQEEFWQKLIASLSTNMMVTSGSYDGNGSDKETNKLGLPYYHAFAVMNALEVVDADGLMHRLI